MAAFIVRYHILLLLFYLSYDDQSQTMAMKSNPKIVIVGAGAAGIAAATTLLDDGFTDITILEVKNRIGGRIDTVPFGKNVIDLGAQWVHGERGNAVYELASKHNLLAHSDNSSEDYTFVRSNAQLVSKPIWQRLQKITNDIEEQRLKDIRNYRGSLGEYTRKKYEDILALPANSDIDKTIAKEYYTAYEKEATADEGANSLNDISARDYAEYEEHDGDAWMNWKDKGNIELLHLLMDTHQTGRAYGKLDGKIKFSKPVVNITWQRDDHKVMLTTQEQEQYEADHVIVTVPLGVLKKFAKDMFYPNLPAAKENAIKALGFGGGNKIFLEFKRPFWHTKWQGAYLLWRNEDLREIRGTNRSWVEGILGFHTLPYQPNVLFSWIVGHHAREVEELTEHEIKTGLSYLLDKFLPESDKKEIINIRFSTWTTDPCYFGGFSYHSMETEKANVNNDQLAEPVKLSNGKPVLLFAGEATESKHYATVHGALESGRREAKRLQEYYK